MNCPTRWVVAQNDLVAEEKFDSRELILACSRIWKQCLPNTGKYDFGVLLIASEAWLLVSALGWVVSEPLIGWWQCLVWLLVVWIWAWFWVMHGCAWWDSLLFGPKLDLDDGCVWLDCLLFEILACVAWVVCSLRCWLVKVVWIFVWKVVVWIVSPKNLERENLKRMNIDEQNLESKIWAVWREN